MKVIYIFLIFFLNSLFIHAQSCDEIAKLVKSRSAGVIYYSSNSEAISSVTFYDFIEGYKHYYFAIVKFNHNYLFKEYLYQVDSKTKMWYSLEYMKSAGKAFWKYIEPHNTTLNCAPDFN